MQQRRTGQALGLSVRREEEEEEGKEGKRMILGSLKEKDTVVGGRLGGGVAASERHSGGLSLVCTLHFSTNDEERALPTNGLAWQTRTAGMGEESLAGCTLASRHDLHQSIGWWEVL